MAGKRSDEQQRPMRVGLVVSYLVGVYGGTLVKKVRDGFAGVQHHHLRTGEFETKDIGLCDSRTSKSKVLA